MRAAFLPVLVTLAGDVVVADDRGRALFHDGTGAEALLSGGEVRVPATLFGCANCHGADALGGREGGVVAPPVTWSALTARTPERPAYDERSLASALFEGTDPGGRRLGEAMPRYEVRPDLLLALTRYLARIEREQQTGIRPDALVVRPPSDPSARAGFEAALAEVNAAGGVHGRLLQSAGPDDRAALDLSDPSRAIGDAVVGAELRALLAAARADGRTSLAPSGEMPHDRVVAMSEAMGLTLDPRASAALIMQPLPDDEAALLDVQAIYVRREALNASLIARATSGPGTLIVASDPFPEAAAWARESDKGRAAAEGYAAALMVTDAALAAGRLASTARLESRLHDIAARTVAVRRFEVP